MDDQTRRAVDKFIGSPEFTKTRIEGLAPSLTLAEVSFAVGEAVAEFLHKYQVNRVEVTFERDAIEFHFAKGLDKAELDDFVERDGYDPKRLYSSLWRQK